MCVRARERVCMGETGGREKERKRDVDGSICPCQAELTKNSCSEK